MNCSILSQDSIQSLRSEGSKPYNAITPIPNRDYSYDSLSFEIPQNITISKKLLNKHKNRGTIILTLVILGYSISSHTYIYTSQDLLHVLLTQSCNHYFRWSYRHHFFLASLQKRSTTTELSKLVSYSFRNSHSY